MDYYSNLNVKSDATSDEIKAAYVGAKATMTKVRL